MKCLLSLVWIIRDPLKGIVISRVYIYILKIPNHQPKTTFWATHVFISSPFFIWWVTGTPHVFSVGSCSDRGRCHCVRWCAECFGESRTRLDHWKTGRTCGRKPNQTAYRCWWRLNNGDGLVKIPGCRCKQLSCGAS